MKNQDFPIITCVMRGYDYNQVKSVVKAILGRKIYAIEVTLNTDCAFDILSKLTSEYGEELCIGAGTVLSYSDAKKAIECGARFILSPIGYSQETIDLCKEKSIISIAGAYTPDEIYREYLKGANIVKVFPASNLGAKYFKSVLEPMEDLRLMAVGGVNSSNVMDYFENGAKHIATAGGIFNKEDILNCDTGALKKSLDKFESVLKLKK